MTNTGHTWKHHTRQFGKRFATGLFISLTLSLVAFEWSSRKPALHLVFDPLDEVHELDTVLVARLNILPPAEPKAKPEARKKQNTLGPVNAVETPPTDPVATDPVEPAAGDPEPPTDPGPVVDPVTPTGTTAPLPPMLVEMLPHFEECLRNGRKDVNSCTEERLHRHLERTIRIPESVTTQIATTVTFEIDATGRIGRVHCAPKVPRDVEKEIERAIRSLPEFVPGRQGGHAVAVYYQIPLRLHRR
jgi:hypothetical protein